MNRKRGQIALGTRRRGFTLIEVLLAATIFAVTASGLFFTFRTGIRAWRTGHRASEIYQTARIAQEMMIRDFHNIAYMPEEDYNDTFRSQLLETNYGQGPMGTINQGLESGIMDPLGLLGLLGEFSTPIDLSLRGEDGEEFDSIEFARYQRARSDEEIDPLGIRRVKYFVREGTLYREEMSVHGYRAGDRAPAQVRDNLSTQGQIAKLFVGSGGETLESTDYGRDDEDLGILPDVLNAEAEPLCDGVRFFDITYGYFRFEQWTETISWDSERFQHRFPLDELAEVTGMNETGYNPRRRAGQDPRNGPLMGMARGQAVSFMAQPDHLPGYIAIQLGLGSGDDDEGRVASFTFFVSMPLAREEFDLSRVDDDNRPGMIRRSTRSPRGDSRGNQTLDDFRM